MKVVRFSSEKAGRENVGLLIDDRVFNFTAALQAYQLLNESVCSCPITSPVALMEKDLFNVGTFSEVLAFAEHHGMMDRFMVSEYRLLAPVARPSKILALGRNYIAHAKELGHAVPTEPVFFAKLNSSVIGPDEPVVYKKGLTRVDHEVELAIVIGKQGSNIPEDDAYSYVAGYTIVNDVTERDFQKTDIAAGNPWTRSKGIDTFCPMGPCIVLQDELPPPVEVDLRLRVNGEVRQSDNTRNMLFKIPQVISYISRLHTLFPGDVIPTGTPEGIGPVVPGDIMECEIQGIGVLRNPVISE